MLKIIIKVLIITGLLMPAIIMFFLPNLIGTKFFWFSMVVFCFLGGVCGRGRNPTLRLWPTIFSGKIDVFPGDRRSRLISSMTSVAPA